MVELLEAHAENSTWPPHENDPFTRVFDGDECHASPWAYTAPIVVFALITALEGYVPRRDYALIYLLKLCAVIAALTIGRAALRDIRPSRRHLPLSVLVGLCVFIIWVVLDKAIPYGHLGARVGFDPFTALQTPGRVGRFLAMRFCGLVVLVPVMEELFWRSFLLRQLTVADFSTIPIGTYSQFAFWTVAGVSAIVHPEWLVAFIANAAYSLLCRKTGSIFAVIVAHAVTNAALGVYVVVARDWVYW